MPEPMKPIEPQKPEPVEPKKSQWDDEQLFDEMSAPPIDEQEQAAEQLEETLKKVNLNSNG